MDWNNVVLAIVVGIFSGSTIGSIYAVFANRHYKRAEAGSMIADAALALLKPYKEQVKILNQKVGLLEKRDRDKARRISSLENDGHVTRTAMVSLEKQHEELQAKMREWNKGIQILVDQIELHDSKPDWRPDGE